MSEKPLCGYCYNECTDDCCDKRRIDVLERKLEEAREEIKENRRDHLKDTRELLRQLDEARELVKECLDRINDGNLKDCIRKKLKEQG